MKTTKVGQRYQVVIPSEICKALQLKPGERLKVELKGSTVLMERYNSKVEQWYGKHKSLWVGVETLDYLERERSSWQRQ